MTIPVSLEAAVQQLQLDHDSSSDAFLEAEGFRQDAADWVEEYTGHILVARDVTLRVRGFSKPRLAAWPIKSDAVPVVTYTRSDGVSVAILGARVDITTRPARLLPPSGTRWPNIPADTVVTVTVRAGYEGDDFVPGNIRRAILVLIAAYDADREGGDVFAKAETAARRLCGRFRDRRL